MIFSPKHFRMGTAALTAIAPVLFDSVIVTLTVYKCMVTLRQSGGVANSPSTLLSKHLLEDGLMYYIVVFSANLVRFPLWHFLISSLNELIPRL